MDRWDKWRQVYVPWFVLVASTLFGIWMFVESSDEGGFMFTLTRAAKFTFTFGVVLYAALAIAMTVTKWLYEATRWLHRWVKRRRG